MTYDPRIHHRRSIRLPGCDYEGGGAYFITICTRDKQSLFGDIVEGEMILTEEGNIVQRTWHALPKTYAPVVLDAFQIMPNHLHGIIVLPGPGLSEALALATGAPVIQPTPDNFVGRFEIRSGRARPTLADSTQSAGKGAASPRRIGMGDVVGAFKSISTIAINKCMSCPGAKPLHENFYEHIIRDTHELELIREYIEQNPQRWLDDPEYPS